MYTITFEPATNRYSVANDRGECVADMDTFASAEAIVLDMEAVDEIEYHKEALRASRRVRDDRDYTPAHECTALRDCEPTMADALAAVASLQASADARTDAYMDRPAHLEEMDYDEFDPSIDLLDEQDPFGIMYDVDGNRRDA